MDDLVTIHRPIRDVFEFVVDHGNDRLWKPFVTTSKKISVGPIGVGSRFEERMLILNRYLSSTVEVLEHEPYSWHVYRSIAPPFPFVAQLSFTPGSLGTTIRGHVEFQAQGVWRLLMPFIRLFFKAQEKHTFARLRIMLETK